MHSRSQEEGTHLAFHMSMSRTGPLHPYPLLLIFDYLAETSIEAENLLLPR
jgi:hypothetical protein